MVDRIAKKLTGLSAVMGLPVYADVKPVKSEAKEYIVFNPSDDRPILWGNNEVIANKITIQVHMFTFGNPNKAIKKMKNYLKQQGFYYARTAVQYESDTKYRHITIEVSDVYLDNEEVM